MAIAQTYGVLQHQIADELGDRTDLLLPLGDSTLTLSPIKNAIQSAIAKWEREPFYFNEIYFTNVFSTVANQETYPIGNTTALFAASPDLFRLHITVNSNRYPLILRTWGYIDDISANPAVTGEPIDYAVIGSGSGRVIRFYPIPNGVYPITMAGSQRYATLANDGDQNSWTEDAYDLIRSEAKLILAQETLHDDDIARRMKLAIYGDPALSGDRGYLYALKAETTRRARAKIIPSFF